MSVRNLNNGVIVAENDSQMRSLIRSMLIHSGQQVFPAVDGLEALAFARQFKARLVLLDIAMPRLNGIQACEAIRKVPGYHDVPIVILTGHDDGRLRAAARRNGAMEFLTKPFRPDLLMARLARYLSIPPEARQAGRAADPVADATLGGRAVVWTTKQPRPPAAQPANPQMDTAREVLRIWRAVQG
jgi:DNA-binding response OmpR family regulator